MNITGWDSHESKSIATFAEEWAKVKAGKPSTLFAADQIYGVHQSPRHYSKSKPPTRKTSSQRQAPYIPWKEYAGVSSHRTPGVSPILMEAQSKHAQAVFTQAEYTLSKLRSKW